jgi:hypothetical protein
LEIGFFYFNMRKLYRQRIYKESAGIVQVPGWTREETAGNLLYRGNVMRHGRAPLSEKAIRGVAEGMETSNEGAQIQRPAASI